MLPGRRSAMVLRRFYSAPRPFTPFLEFTSLQSTDFPTLPSFCVMERTSLPGGISRIYRIQNTCSGEGRHHVERRHGPNSSGERLEERSSLELSARQNQQGRKRSGLRHQRSLRGNRLRSRASRTCEGGNSYETL